MSRISWNEFHMKQAELISARSTCAKMKVGAVLVKDNRTISQGYNGVGPGCQHCIDVFTEKGPNFQTEHKIWSLNNELHAEQNCILWAAREGIATVGCYLYTIYSPCINCAKVIYMAGVTRVFYKTLYEDDTSGITYLEKNNILCVKI